MRALAHRSATTMIVMGVLAIIFGILGVAWPVTTALALVILWGIYALADGIAALGMAFQPIGASAKLFFILTGIVGVLAGLLAVFRPISSAEALTWVLGLWLIARGILEIVSAFGGGAGNARWLLLLGGVLWIIAGWIFASHPGVSALAIATWLGMLAIFWGIFAVVAGWMARSELKRLGEAQG